MSVEGSIHLCYDQNIVSFRIFYPFRSGIFLAWDFAFIPSQL